MSQTTMALPCSWYPWKRCNECKCIRLFFMLRPLLGEFLVFIKTIGFGYEIVLKDMTRFFFKIFMTPTRFQKFAKTNFNWVSKHQFSNMWYLSIYKANFCMPIITNFIISKLIFNVKKMTKLHKKMTILKKIIILYVHYFTSFKWTFKFF
jgi:hypothetical protein